VTVFRLADSSRVVPSALVIEPHLPHLLFVLSTLSALHFDVTVAGSFKDAKTALIRARPTVLIADVRLHEYNGLHLVLRGQSAYPGLLCLVMAHADDPVLQLEAERLGATYVALPTTREEFVAALHRTLLQARGADAGSPIRPPFERRHGERRGTSSPLRADDRRGGERRRDPANAVHALAAQG
jgi:DNA-binding response OmpR family regulator